MTIWAKEKANSEMVGVLFLLVMQQFFMPVYVGDLFWHVIHIHLGQELFFFLCCRIAEIHHDAVQPIPQKWMIIKKIRSA